MTPSISYSFNKIKRNIYGRYKIFSCTLKWFIYIFICVYTLSTLYLNAYSKETHSRMLYKNKETLGIVTGRYNTGNLWYGSRGILWSPAHACKFTCLHFWSHKDDCGVKFLIILFFGTDISWHGVPAGPGRSSEAAGDPPRETGKVVRQKTTI